MNKLDWWFFFGLIIIMAIVCGMVSNCRAGNVMVYGNLPPWEITDARFDAINGDAGVWVTEKNDNKFYQYKTKEGWTYNAPEMRVSFNEVFNLLYDKKKHWIYFRIGESRFPCAYKKIKRFARDEIKPVKTGCKLIIEPNMVWLEVGE